MALSDCSHCWNTPCTCGHEWHSMPIETLERFREMLNRVILDKKTKETIEAGKKENA